MRVHSACLKPHHQQDCTIVGSISFDVRADNVGLAFKFHLEGEINRIALPASQQGQRRDELWKTTCFEAFLSLDGSGRYVEFNFSPSGDWAAYSFDGYRRGRQDQECAPPDIRAKSAGHGMTLLATVSGLPAPILASRGNFGASAVIEGINGAIYHWALDHPESRPDFHHASNFSLGMTDR